MGTLLWDAVPKDKYTGDLVTLRNIGPDRAVPDFYYVGLPEVRAAHIGGPADKKTSIPLAKTPECVLASGTRSISLPTSNDEFLKATGLVADPPYTSLRYPTACADIPLDAGFELVFKGQDGSSEATVKIPFRNLAFAPGDSPNTCRLSLQLGDSFCYLGGPFYSSAFVAHDNDAQTIQIAQGAVAGSAQAPPV